MIKFFVLIMMSLSCLSQAKVSFSEDFISTAKQIINKYDASLNVAEILSYQCPPSRGEPVCILQCRITQEDLQILFVPVLGDDIEELDSLNNI